MCAINKFKIQVHSWYAFFSRDALSQESKFLVTKSQGILIYSTVAKREGTEKLIINLKQMARARNNLLVPDNLIHGLVYIISYMKFNNVWENVHYILHQIISNSSAHHC